MYNCCMRCGFLIVLCRCDEHLLPGSTVMFARSTSSMASSELAVESSQFAVHVIYISYACAHVTE